MRKRTFINGLLCALLLFLLRAGLSPHPTSSPPTPHAEVVKGASSEGNLAHVMRVIDGDTIKLESGETVRYIGIDAPETIDPRHSVQCFGHEAKEKNKELVEGKAVRLVKDVSERDRYNRLLRYVFVGDVLINEYLVREGVAHARSYPPDIRYQSVFSEAERAARAEHKGLWGNCLTGSEKHDTMIFI